MSHEIDFSLREKALELLAKGALQDISFSNSTYLVELIEKDLSFFCFFQFDENDRLFDAFCSCDTAHCHHLTAAFLCLYPPNEPAPLHKRFEKSFWKAITWLFASQPNEVFKKSGHSLELIDTLSCKISATSTAAWQKLEKLVFNRSRETPENSLKFSNLDEEQIERWRQGRADEKLRYELSLWSDLGKWAFLMQHEPQLNNLKLKNKTSASTILPHVQLREDKNGLPTHLEVSIKDLVFEFYLTKETLGQIIESLSTVAPQLIIVDAGQQQIESITFDAKKRVFHIQHLKKSSYKPSKEHISLDGWLYERGKGFFRIDPQSLLNQKTIGADQIEEALTQFGSCIAQHLKSDTIHFAPRAVNYSLFFDENWNLHIFPYLFDPKDLSASTTALFGKWAYLEKKGFYSLSEEPHKERVVAQKAVSHYIADHKLFLNEKKGFAVFLSGLEAKIGYEITANHDLRFTFAIEGMAHDFGDFVYVKEMGFFLKKLGKLSSLLYSGLEIRFSEVASFIRNYHEELDSIANFFCPTSPIARIGLRVQLYKKTILITPEIELKALFSLRDYILFDAVLYVKGMGFFEIPDEMLLPVAYQKPITIKKEKFNHFLDHELPALTPYILHLDPCLKLPSKKDIQLKTLSKTTPFSWAADICLTTEMGQISIYELWQAYLKKERFAFTAAGRIDLMEPHFAWLSHLNHYDSEKNQALLSTLDLIKIDAAHPLQLMGQKTALLQQIVDFKKYPPPNLEGLKSLLRAYQQQGVLWLWGLYKNGLSALLCDEMGLGKTHQAMALLQALHNESNGLFLVIAPTSVIYHWQEKLTAFVPNLPLYIHHGLHRSPREWPKNGVVLTSYGILRQDKEYFKKIEWDAAIFDELQVAKNAKSRLHQALLQMKARFRLGLSGTPIENNLYELKSLFDIVLPHYLPSQDSFKKQFILPLERGEGFEQKAHLHRLIHPFILRRRKKEVLSELPDKTEDHFYADLTDEQKVLYNEVLEQARGGLKELYNPTGLIPYIHIFATLSRLKQICDHPALAARDVKNYKRYSSGKWELFKELLDEALSSEQKVVVFSQYLMMLDIIELYLKENEIGFTGIRGDTVDRAGALKRFEKNPSCRVFVGSLQAAGLGIDLTAASVVILYDRWWNPARENQAIDRVHRLGQLWGVQVYRLLTHGTIEERIDAIIERKKKLIEEMLPVDDETEIKSLSRQDLVELFKTIPY